MNFKTMLALFLCFISATSFFVAGAPATKPASPWQSVKKGIAGLFGLSFGYTAMGAVRSYQQGESQTNTTIVVSGTAAAVGGLSFWSWWKMKPLRDARAEFKNTEASYEQFGVSSIFKDLENEHIEDAKEEIAQKIQKKDHTGQRNKKADKIWFELDKDTQDRIENDVKGQSLTDNKISDRHELFYLDHLLEEEKIKLGQLLSPEQATKITQDFIRTNLILKIGIVDKASRELKIVEADMLCTHPIAKQVYDIVEPVAGAFVVGAGLGAAGRVWAGGKEKVDVGGKFFTFGFNRPKY